MPIYHVAVTTAPDYVTRREPHRAAHIARLSELRARGAVIGGGPAPDGSSADLFYRAPDEATLGRLLEEDPYRRAGAWTGHRATAYERFLEPWRPVEIVLDGSRPASLVSGRAADPEMASFALIELRGAGRLAFGGLFAGGRTLALMTDPDAARAVAALAESGQWEPGSLAARSLLWVL